MKIILAASAASTLVAVPAWAQERTDDVRLADEIIVTGTKTGEFGAKSGIPLEKVPQSVQVVDEGDILARGARTVEDALKVVPSATVAHNRVSGFAGNTLRIRGFSPQQIRNGIYQRFYDSTDPSALSNIERIEVLKGPSAVLYGQSGVGGIISIVTKQPTRTFLGSVALTGGSYDQRMATFDVGGPLSEDMGIRLTGEVERSGSFIHHLDLDRENVGVALEWNPSSSVSAHFVGEYLHRKTLENPGLPTVGTVISNGVARAKRSTYLGEPNFSRQENHAPLLQIWVDVKLGGTWTLTPRAQYSEWNNTSRSTTLLAPDPTNLTLIPRVARPAGEKDKFYLGQLDLAGEVRTGSIAHKLLMGVESNHDRVPFRMGSVVPCGVHSIDVLNPVYGCGPATPNFGFLAEAKVKGFAFYAQDQVALTEAWNIIAGIRSSISKNDNLFATEFFASEDSTKLKNISWQLGTTYALSGGLSVFGGYNTGYDLGAVTGNRKADGSAFEPETSDQAEVGLRIIRDTVRATVSVFRIRRNNVGVGDPNNIGFQVQDGQFRTRGFEVEGEWSPAPGWNLQGGYAYLDAEVSRSTDAALVGSRLAETPKHALTGSTRVQMGRVELRAAGNYAGPRKMINGGSVTLPGYATIDVGAGTALGPVRLNATLTNLFDKTYYFTDNASRYSLNTEDRVLPGEPRTLSIRAAYRFGAEQR